MAKGEHIGCEHGALCRAWLRAPEGQRKPLVYGLDFDVDAIGQDAAHFLLSAVRSEGAATSSPVRGLWFGVRAQAIRKVLGDWQPMTYERIVQVSHEEATKRTDWPKLLTVANELGLEGKIMTEVTVINKLPGSKSYAAMFICEDRPVTERERCARIVERFCERYRFRSDHECLEDLKQIAKEIRG